MARLHIENMKDVSRKDVQEKLGLSTEDFSHNACGDARRQAEIFFALKNKTCSRHSIEKR